MCNLGVAGSGLGVSAVFDVQPAQHKSRPRRSALIKRPGQESGMTVIREAGILQGSLPEWAADKAGYKWRLGITTPGCWVNNEPAEFITPAGRADVRAQYSGGEGFLPVPAFRFRSGVEPIKDD